MFPKVSYIQKIVGQGNEKLLVVLNSVLTPVNATVATLKVQFYYVALIFIISSFIISIWLSKRISKPIVKLNECAKNLAKGNFDIGLM